MNRLGTDKNIDARRFEGGEDIEQRFIELGRLSASLLHEISNPLTSALLELEQIELGLHFNIKAIKRSLVRLSRYVNAARQQIRLKGTVKEFSLGSQVQQVKRLVAPLAKDAAVQFVIENSGAIRLRGDPVKFQQILSNLVINAIEAYAQSKSTDKRIVKICTYKMGSSVRIEVIDYAGVINKRQQLKLFNPFFSTKDGFKSGLGLGLFIVESYLKDDFKGTISVSSSAEFGTRFIITLPLK